MKTITEFPNYCITKSGRVWSKARSENSMIGKWLTPRKNRKEGYLMVCLYKNKKRCPYYLHRLVLETYVGLCPKDMECCHNDGDKLNNCLSNLRWDTITENNRDTVRHGTHRFSVSNGEKNGNAKLTEQDVKMIIYIWQTGLFIQKEIAKYFNVRRATVNNIINKKTWKHIWAEKENLEI